MAVLPPGYHIKCSFCHKTEGPFPSVNEIEALITDINSEWMEIRTGGEEFHSCTSEHFDYPYSETIPNFFRERMASKEWKENAHEKIRRGFA